MLISAIVFGALAFILAHAIWFYRLILDFPIGVRLVLSVLPAYVLYRVVPILRLPRWRTHGGVGIFALGFLPPIGAGFAALVLYHLWRDVRRKPLA